jgi:hypothetical protein
MVEYSYQRKDYCGVQINYLYLETSYKACGSRRERGRTGRVAQVVECLPSKPKDLSSSPKPHKKEGREKKRARQDRT